jgi:hypothetical protein
MFQSIANRFQRQSSSGLRRQNGCGMSRKLGMEVMEGRLMLSTTTAQMSPSEIRPAQFSLPAGQFPSVISLAPVGTQPVDGGFITTNVSNAGWQLDGVLVASGDVSGSFSLTDLITRGHFYSTNANGMGPVDFQSGGLQPLVIHVSSNGSDDSPIRGAIIASPDNRHASNEGGSIPIHSLASSLRKEENSSWAQLAATNLAPEQPFDSHHPARSLAAASEKAIAGEWARAMVFEIAGDEPRAAGVPAANERSLPTAREERGEPLSAKELPGGENRTNQRHDQARDVESRAQQTGKPNAEAAAAAEHFNPSSVTLELNDAKSQTDSSALDAQPRSDKIDSGQSDPSDVSNASAVSAAFEEFDDDTPAIVESAARSDWRQRIAAATSILMVVALDGLTARNARRATSEGFDINASKLRKNPRLTGVRKQ